MKHCLAGLLLACGVGVAAAPAPRPAGIAQQAFVWQQQWSVPVQHAVRERGASFERLILLAAEFEWRCEGQVRVSRVAIDWSALPRGLPVGLALRVNDPPRACAPTPALAASVSRELRRLRADAASGRVAVAEVLIDLDAPTRKLTAYAQWLQGLRSATKDRPLTITALPDWLASPEFAALAAATDGYVLQLHSLAPVKTGELRAARLFDDSGATRAMAMADALGRPYRIALPTHAYVLMRVAGAAPVRIGEVGGTGMAGEVIAADAAVLAAFVRRLQGARHDALRGVIWFRLPVDGDRNNWAWPTLQAVRLGQVPQAVVSVFSKPAADGALQLWLRNDGNAAAALPAKVRVSWSGSPPVSRDVLAGYEVGVAAAGELLLQPDARGRGASVNPGAMRMLAWLRFDHAVDIHVSTLD